MVTKCCTVYVDGIPFNVPIDLKTEDEVRECLCIDNKDDLAHEDEEEFPIDLSRGLKFYEGQEFVTMKGGAPEPWAVAADWWKQECVGGTVE